MLLLIPDLLAPAEFLRPALAGLELPGLTRLLAHARVVAREAPMPDFQRSTPSSRWLFAQFGIEVGADDDAPWAPAHAALDGIVPPDGARFAMALPARFALARDHVVLGRLASMQTPPAEPDETARLIEPIAELFDELTLLTPTPTRWYVSGAMLDGLRASDPLRAIGRNLDRWLPVDASGAMAGPARRWRKLHNEVQMSWHARFGEDAAINALWLQGGSDPLAAPTPPRWTTIAASSADDRWRAAAAWTRLAFVDAPTLQAAGDADLCVIDRLTMPVIEGDIGAWREVMTTLDRDWFAPLAERSGAHRLVACSETGWRELDWRGRGWRFWSKRSLASQLTA